MWSARESGVMKRRCRDRRGAADSAPGGNTMILLTYLERAALVELGVRPTFDLPPCPDGEVTTECVRASAEAWSHAATLTLAGQTGLLPRALGSEVALLLAEAIPEAAGDLDLVKHNRERWRGGDASQGIPGLGSDSTEGCFASHIARDTLLLDGFRSLDRHLQAEQVAPGRATPERARGSAPARSARGCPPSGSGRSRSQRRSAQTPPRRGKLR
jgi:hypothetical protein